MGIPCLPVPFGAGGLLLLGQTKREEHLLPSAGQAAAIENVIGKRLCGGVFLSGKAPS